MPGEHLDLSSGDEPQKAGEQVGGAESTVSKPSDGGRFLGIQFACCGVYARIFINRAGTAYEGHCPRCSKPIRIAIGPGGSDTRFFTAY